MKLSEAIRLGAVMHPQIYRSLRSPLGTCALGAVGFALGCLDSLDTTVDWKSTADFYRVTNKEIGLHICPVCQYTPQPTSDQNRLLIAHLNDDHRWTRECIADWIEIHEIQTEINNPQNSETEISCELQPSSHENSVLKG